MSDLKDRYDKAVQARAIAEAKNEQAVARLQELRDEAKATYGIESVEEAEEKLKAIKARIEEITTKMEKTLEDSGF